jgi:hypothetical protein
MASFLLSGSSPLWTAALFQMNNAWVESYVTTDGESTSLGFTTRFLLLSDSCWFVDVGLSLWWQDGSVIYNCCWPVLTSAVETIAASVDLLITPLHEPSRKSRLQQYHCGCVRIRWRGNVFAEPLPRNGSTRYNIVTYTYIRCQGTARQTRSCKKNSWPTIGKGLFIARQWTC